MADFGEKKTKSISDKPAFTAWNRIGSSVPQTRPGAGLEARQIKHLAERASPPWLAFGTELRQSVPHHESAHVMSKTLAEGVDPTATLVANSFRNGHAI